MADDTSESPYNQQLLDFILHIQSEDPATEDVAMELEGKSEPGRFLATG